MLIVSTPPESEPVSVAEAKSHCRVDIADDDTLIGNLIKAARELVETAVDRSFIDTVWKWLLPSFPSPPIVFPRAPLSGITTVKYIAPGDSSYSTWDHSAYGVLITPTHQPGQLSPIPGESWPSTEIRDDAVEITFTAGYGSSSTDVPECARQAILLFVGHWYDSRSPVLIGTISKELELSLRSLLQSIGWGRYC